MMWGGERELSDRSRNSKAWEATHVFESVPSGQTRYIDLKTGSKFLAFEHMDIRTNATSLLVQKFKTPTINSQGSTEMLVGNFNDRISINKDFSLYVNTTYTDEGVEQAKYKIFSVGNFFGSASSTNIDGIKWFLAQSEEYVIKITNTGSQTRDFSITIVLLNE